jgi:hypothetical protein
LVPGNYAREEWGGLESVMMTQTRSWLRENSTLVYFLVAQAIAVGGGAAALIAYSVRLETRVHIMETRGAEYTVARMDEMKQRIAILEIQIKNNAESIVRIVNVMTRELGKNP